MLLSNAQSCPTLCNPMVCSMPGLPVPHHLLKFALVHVHCSGDAIQTLHSLMSCALNISQHQGLSPWVGCLHRWQKYWSFSFSISPSNEYSGMIYLRIDLFYLFAVQGTLVNLFYNHSSKVSTLWLSAFFAVQLSQPQVTTGKIIALTIWTFVGRVMSLLFNMLSRL